MTADAIVIDASAAISMVRGEEAGSVVRRALSRPPHRRLLVPEVFWIEITNILVRRYGQPVDTVLDAVTELDDLGMSTVHSSRGALLSSVALMFEHGLSAYDATYLALAETLDADLLTLDRELAVAAGDRAVNLGRDGVREGRAPYRLEPWITWDEAAEYMKSVRRVTVEAAGRRR